MLWGEQWRSTWPHADSFSVATPPAKLSLPLGADVLRSEFLLLLKIRFVQSGSKLQIRLVWEFTISVRFRNKFMLNTCWNTWIFVSRQICQVLQLVCKKEGLNLPSDLAKKIATQSNRNLRRAILMCEACRVQQWVFHKNAKWFWFNFLLRYPFSSNQDVTLPDWELYLRETANMIIQQQSPKRYTLD